MIRLLEQIGYPAGALVVILIFGYVLRETFKSLLKAELERLKSALTKDLEDVKQAHRIELDQLKSRLTKDLEDVKQMHRIELEGVRQQHAAVIELIRQVLSERFEALKEIEHYRSEFAHAIDHIRNKGHLHYKERLDGFYWKLRETVRKHRLILGEEMERAVVELTDAGQASLDPNADAMRFHQATVAYRKAYDDTLKNLPEGVRASLTTSERVLAAQHGT
ncbi:MAG: hypothetical protein ACREM3_10010 [Candidatus Rokuibacteriota bacterium]